MVFWTYKVFVFTTFYFQFCRYVLYTLHSSMQSNDQKRVFKSVPQGVRKIVGTGMLIDKLNISRNVFSCIVVWHYTIYESPLILCFRFWQLILQRLALLSMMLYMWLIQGKWKRYFNLNNCIKFGYQRSFICQMLLQY